MSHYLQKIVTALLLIGATALMTGAESNAASTTAASDWVITDHTKLRLVSATTATGDGESSKLTLGLQFELKPGWKIYWRSPGDAGFPPSVNWEGSRNLETANMQWPIPERFSVLGLETLGYKDKVVLPISAAPNPSADGVDMRARVRYLACDDICIPYEAKLELDLPGGDQAPSEFAHLINQYTAKVPGNGRAHGIEVATLHTPAEIGDPTKPGLLHITARADTPFSTPDVFMEGAPGLAYSKPMVSLSDGGKTARFDIRVHGIEYLEDAQGPKLDGRQFTVTLIDGERSAERMLDAVGGTPPVAATPMPDIQPGAGPSFALILVLAVIGGLILNLMPCVLPVLSLKILSLVSHGGGSARDVRLGFMASAAGIISTFLVLAAILAALRTGGAVIGWGIQFQQPWFLTALIMMVTLFACNLWGFFEIRLPGFASNLGGSNTDTKGMSGHFLSGVFATLLATPCTAPFLGTAVGFALAGSVGEMMSVFAALGVGLALPYLLVAAQPKLATWLPKPGAWMVRLKFLLGLLLAGTGVWLIFVLVGVAGETGALVVGGIAIAAATVLYVAHRTNGLGLKASLPGLAVLTLLALSVPTIIPAGAKDMASTGESRELEALWQPFDLEAIPTLIRDGKTVFVDVTADWCITCQVNKGVVLERSNILKRFKDKNVVAMKADWTRPNDDIARYLASFGRFGIPFNAVYGPGAETPIVLPELLSDSAVLAAFDTAGPDAAYAKSEQTGN